MTRRLTALSILLLALVPTVGANAPSQILELGEVTATGKGQVVPNYGYWVYGEVSNTEFYNIREVIIEVTLYDQSNNILDTLTTMVRPTILEAGTKAPFLVKSNTQHLVSRIQTTVKSYQKTPNYNFPYIVVDEVSEVTQGGFSARITNTHSHTFVYEAEVIATFYNIDGDVVEIKSYGANNYGKFEPGVSETFTLQSEIMTPVSVRLQVQCNRYYRAAEAEITLSTDTPVHHSMLQLNFTYLPKSPGHRVDVTFTSPAGHVSVVPVNLYLDNSYTMNINASELGLWNVKMSSPILMVNNSIGYIEAVETETTFTVVEAPEIKPPVISGESSDDTDSELGLDDLEKIKDSIPGFPVASVLIAVMAVAWFRGRRGLAYHY